MVLLVGYSFSLETIYELIGSGLGESASEVAQSGLRLGVALACVEVCTHAHLDLVRFRCCWWWRPPPRFYPRLVEEFAHTASADDENAPLPPRSSPRSSPRFLCLFQFRRISS